MHLTKLPSITEYPMLPTNPVALAELLKKYDVIDFKPVIGELVLLSPYSTYRHQGKDEFGKLKIGQCRQLLTRTLFENSWDCSVWWGGVPNGQTGPSGAQTARHDRPQLFHYRLKEDLLSVAKLLKIAGCNGFTE